MSFTRIQEPAVPHFCKTGIAVEKRITDTKEPTLTLYSENYRIIVEGKIV